MNLEDIEVAQLPGAFSRLIQPDAPGEFKADYSIDVKHCAPLYTGEQGCIMLTISHAGVKLLELGLDGMRALVLAAKVQEAANKQHQLDDERASAEWPELSPPPG